MEGFSLILAMVVVTALAFDFTNGFHDTANAMATTISTGALKPKVAVTMSAVLNLVGAFLSVEVANTISKGLVDESGIRPEVIFAALVGAILWNLLTWLVGLPSSSSHALMGGLVGATLASAGPDAVHGGALITKVVLPAVAAPVVAGVAAAVATRLSYTIGGKDGKAAEKGHRAGQIASAGLVSLAHGTNDAQKTMGVITLALVTGGALAPGSNPPTWVILSAGLAIALGTYIGGWRIIRTMGTGLTDLQPQQGFAAQTSAATAILASSHLGFSLSTTHVVSGAVMGAGLGRKGGVVRWSTAGRMTVAWVLTLPAAALVGAGAEAVTDLGDWGTALVAVFLVAASAAIWLVSRRQVVDHTNVTGPAATAEEPAGVVTQALAAVAPPAAGQPAPAAEDTASAPTPADAPTATVPAQPTAPAPASPAAEPVSPAPAPASAATPPAAAV
ncbi:MULTISPECIES: inorganic phosphate transporter [Streptomyces]|uniref:Phosphate transporter n=1 Tax=Streptomyces thermoviolaceus subsp. thermoviolaceus TaxID=66860 RepID=A0ABX0YQT2_STRTL|nr:inorganic phosphate transporter [Streptomyces thermoviolaceus]MCM3266236.1 inorganic phosphate transporter [Streptomyces thermoviolaceus]NJP14362.1 inorganic phosphate transporter [Streptomyces thermoviolaceus subsp. thermoviolaceus]WTD49760.1 inorganic phosphate transporter [Streptomyces thermoviolaceus]GGV81411.1 phosphate transporter [Streptomyces thermoviolaceus subsp. apingens]GHA78082.1 phosphate transporter [Streptomyces thermoviolaceus subsp. thermoviolaceus]